MERFSGVAPRAATYGLCITPFWGGARSDFRWILPPHVEQLVAHIDAFIADYNQTAGPFVRTKSEVHQKRLKPCFADQ